jgi:hypothetical protein
MDSSVSPTYGNQEGTAYNGYFQCAWSLRTLRVKLKKTGAKVVSDIPDGRGRYAERFVL